MRGLGVLFDLAYYDAMHEPSRRGFTFVAGHDCRQNLYHVVRPRMADWLAERLGGRA